MAVHARLKNEFTEDEKCHNLMRWLISSLMGSLLQLQKEQACLFNGNKIYKEANLS